MTTFATRPTYPVTVRRQDPFLAFDKLQPVDLTCTCSDPAAHAVAALITRGLTLSLACHLVYVDKILDPVRVQGDIHDRFHEAFPWLRGCCAGDRVRRAA